MTIEPKDELRIVAPPVRYTIEQLVAGMTPKSAHEAFDWGDDVGREIWDVEEEDHFQGSK